MGNNSLISDEAMQEAISIIEDRFEVGPISAEGVVDDIFRIFISAQKVDKQLQNDHEN